MSLKGNCLSDCSPATQIIEEFWGVELAKDKKTAKWDAQDEDDSMFVSNNLELRQACLGPGAKEGERNIVQITVDDGAGKTSTFSIVSLRAGLAEQATLFLNLQPPVIFKLVEGSGPVNLVGQTSETLDGLDDSEDDSEEEEEEMTLEKEALGLPQKRPASSSSKAPAAKVSKKDKSEDLDLSFKSIDDEDEDDDDDDDEEEEDDEDEEDEEEESDEEEEIPKPIIPKKAQINGKPKTPLKEKTAKLNTVRTPQPQQKTKFQQKGSLSVPSKSAAQDKKRSGDKKAWKPKVQGRRC